MQSVDLGSSFNNTTKPKNQLFCRLDGLTPIARKEQRATSLHELGLMGSGAAPIFEEATQRAASFSGAPISILGLVVADELWFKSALGLSTIDLTNQLATQRKIALEESFSTYVIDSQQPLLIANALNSNVFAHSILVQHYGVKAYLGVPLITAQGICIGTLEVMDWNAREFDDRDIDYLTLLARWCLGEFKRHQILKLKLNDLDTQKRSRNASPENALLFEGSDLPWLGSDIQPKSEFTGRQLLAETPPVQDLDPAKTSPIKLKLLSQLTQELKTPLTSVIGMASVLHREVYGPLTIKQREYLEIIHDSGQNLISLVDEIVSLGILSDRSSEIDLTKVDVEMLCQQVVNGLEDLSQQYQQKLSFSIEPGNRIWTLDKEKIRQSLYYLIASVLEMSEPGGEVKIHVSQRDLALNIAVGTSHPWLGNDFSESKLDDHAVTHALNLNNSSSSDLSRKQTNRLSSKSHQVLTSEALMVAINNTSSASKNANKIPRDILGLLFCCHLTEIHGGRVAIQGSPGSGYRYLLQIPPNKSV